MELSKAERHVLANFDIEAMASVYFALNLQKALAEPLETYAGMIDPTRIAVLRRFFMNPNDPEQEEPTDCEIATVAVVYFARNVHDALAESPRLEASIDASKRLRLPAEFPTFEALMDVSEHQRGRVAALRKAMERAAVDEIARKGMERAAVDEMVRETFGRSAGHRLPQVSLQA